MASWYIGLNRGEERPSKIVVSTSAQSVDFELRIDSGKSSTKEDAILAMRVLEQYILSNGVPAGATGTDLPPN